MIKKWFMVLMLGVSILGSAPAKISAADDNVSYPLLAGKMFYAGASETQMRVAGITAITDASDSSAYQVYSYATNNVTYIAWHEFEAPQVIDAYRLLSSGPANDKVELRLYDASGDVVHIIKNPVTTGVKTVIDTQYDIKKVAFVNKTTGAHNVKNLEVYSPIDQDRTPPNEVTQVRESHNDIASSIYWVNPSDLDFDHVSIYKNNKKVGESKNGYFYIPDLAANQSYNVELVSVDKSGNESNGYPLSFTSDSLTSLLDGKPMVHSDEFGVGEETTTAMTDNAKSAWAIRAPNAKLKLHNWAWYEFENPVRIEGYSVLISSGTASFNNGLHVLLYDENDNVLYDSDSSTNFSGETVSIGTVFNVKKVALYNDTTADKNVQEFKVYTGSPRSLNALKPPANVTATFDATIAHNQTFKIQWDSVNSDHLLYYYMYVNGVRTQYFPYNGASIYNYTQITDKTGGETSIQMSSVSKSGVESVLSNPIVISKLSPVPQEVSNLQETHTGYMVTLSFDLPTSPYFSHGIVYRNGVEIDRVYNGEFNSYDTKAKAGESYRYRIRTFYSNGDRSQGSTIDVQM